MGGDLDWAPTSESYWISISGGVVRYGARTWDCYSVTQDTVALSSGESEFHVAGRLTWLRRIARRSLTSTANPQQAEVWTNEFGVGKDRHLELGYLWVRKH